jgi:peptidoglycan/LPS O-acetylase OafA/YrhL
VRALAVSGVLLYHARVSWLPGGFLGVDLFFVLSGYLITSLLLAEHLRAGRIDLLRFWLGRARRLLPAAVLVIAVCLVVGAVFLPSDLDKLRADALTSLLYVNNWHQIFGTHSYFAAFGRPSLLQQYWSLAVEEQFYLVWPLLLAGGFALRRRQWLLPAAVVAGVVSAGLMALLYHPGADPSRVYYGTDTRAAPLMVGVILAFAWPLGRMTARANRSAALVLDGIGAAGLAVVALAMLGWHDYDPFLYRGGFVIVALAAAALIAAAGHPASQLGRALGTAPLRWIGQRSYGIYLWHWPVMALTRPTIDLRWSAWILVPAQVAVTLGLATLSYHYVEMPIRRKQAWPAVKAWLDDRRPHARLAAVGATAALAGIVIASAAVVPASASKSPHRPLASAAASAPVSPVPVASVRKPPAGSSSASTRSGVLAVGASVMLAAQPDLERRLHARVDAAVGRQPSEIIDRLQRYRDAHALPPNVVVQIGDNGPVWSADMTRLRAVLSGVPHVVLVNIREPTSWQTEVNDTLAQAGRTWPNATIADWLAASSNPSLLYDAAHPDPAGAAVYANIVARALAGQA